MTHKTLTQNTPQIVTGAIYSDDPRELLLQILQIEGATLETVRSSELTLLAENLTAVAGSGKREGSSWSRSYLHQVLHGKLTGSPKLAAACRALIAEKQGENPLKTRSHPVTVLALGNLEPGTIVWGDTHHCDNPSCSLPFLKRSPRQRYCSPGCRQADHKRKTAS